jgi:transcriptional regulator GlxA family with amidase domain
MLGLARPLHVSLVAIPDAAVSTLTGIYDVLNSFRMFAGAEPALPEEPPFTVEIVGAAAGPVELASGVPVEASRGVGEIEATDIIIVPSVILKPGGWRAGRYPELVAWAKRMHEQGTVLCSACSGVFLLAETGLFDGREATVHWGYAEAFSRAFPNVPLRPERVLVVAGEREQLVTSGASMTWHDLVLYLIARHVGATAAQAVARLFALQWHHDGLAPYIVFHGRKWPRRFRSRRGAGMAVDAFLRREPGRGDGAPLGPAGAHLQAALHPGDRLCANRICAAAQGGGRQAPPGADRRAGGRDQLAGRLRGRRLFPAAVQAFHGADAGRLSPALSTTGLRPLR